MSHYLITQIKCRSLCHHHFTLIALAEEIDTSLRHVKCLLRARTFPGYFNFIQNKGAFYNKERVVRIIETRTCQLSDIIQQLEFLDSRFTAYINAGLLLEPYALCLKEELKKIFERAFYIQSLYVQLRYTLPLFMLIENTHHRPPRKISFTEIKLIVHDSVFESLERIISMVKSLCIRFCRNDTKNPFTNPYTMRYLTHDDVVSVIGLTATALLQQ